MKKTRNISSVDFEFNPDCLEYPSGISETVPNQAITVDELLNRHRLGMSLTATKNGLYEFDDEAIETFEPNILHAPDRDLTDVTEAQAVYENKFKEHEKRRKTASAEPVKSRPTTKEADDDKQDEPKDV